MNITVIGTGYVGIITSVILADFGNNVWGLDIEKERVKNLKKAIPPIYEPGLEDLLKRGVKSERLKFTTSYKEALAKTDIIFICVGTPQSETGEVDTQYVLKSTEEIAKNLKNESIIILKSTVPPGIHHELKKILDKKTKVKYEFASVPEFLREGSAIDDSLKPSRIVIGVESQKAQDKLLQVHRQLPGERIITDIVSAQMIKYTANAFLATKISFANAIARISDLVNADVADVMKGIGLDPRIGNSFLYPGLGFGGSCFPKDIKGLYYLAKKAGYNFKILEAVDEINRDQVTYILEKTKQKIKSFKSKKIAILGLAFKPETDDMREARVIPLINSLLEQGAQITAYDPIAENIAKKIFNKKIKFAQTSYKTCLDADILFIVTEWNEFKELDLEIVKKLMKGKLIVDGRNIYNPKEVKKLGFEYIGVGRR